MRHYGLLANGGREEKLALCRRLLLVAALAVQTQVETTITEAARRCPACGEGCLHWVEDLPRGVSLPPAVIISYDTS